MKCKGELNEKDCIAPSWRKCMEQREPFYRLKRLTAICLLSFLLISFGIGTDSGAKTSGRIDPGPAHSMVS